MTEYQQHKVKVNKFASGWYIPVPSDMIKHLEWKDETEVKLRTAWYEDEGGVLEVYSVEKENE
tara:strand:- start:929 stop:1117 length:189 start_codon:yes stop_codon:yes gene_type:complete